MKKYLMGGIAAIAICAAFTSCSKSNELFDQNAAEQAKQQTSEQKITSDYQTAFENAFGKPASNQDWGLAKYGSIKKAGTRAAQSVVEPDNKNKQKPAQPAFSNEITMPTQYKNTLAEAKTIEGIELLKNNYRAGGTYYIDAEQAFKTGNFQITQKIEEIKDVDKVYETIVEENGKKYSTAVITTKDGEGYEFNLKMINK